MPALRQAIRVQRGSYGRARLGMAGKAPIRRTISGRCWPTGAGEPRSAMRRLANQSSHLPPSPQLDWGAGTTLRLPAVGCFPYLIRRSVATDGRAVRAISGYGPRYPVSSPGQPQADLPPSRWPWKSHGPHCVRRDLISEVHLLHHDQPPQCPASSVSPTTLRSPRLPPWSPPPWWARPTGAEILLSG